MNTEWIALRACVMVEQKNKCAMCGKVLKDHEFTLHHIIPRVEGGKDELDNLIGLCDMCHNIAEYKKYNREEIVNCRYIDYPNIKRSRFIKLAPLKRNNEPEYDYPKVIILQEKYTIPKKIRHEFSIKTSISIIKDKNGIILNRPNKYILRYGKSITEISQIFGVTLATIHNWNKSEKKKAWMEEILKNL